MFQEFLAQSRLLILPMVALVIFFVTFVIVVYYVLFRMKKRDGIDHVASLPLEPDEDGYRVPDDAPAPGQGRRT